MTDITHIKTMLAARADAVCSYLLPSGKRAGNEWKIGSVDGEKGESLSVCTGGAKAGTWADFATGQGGDLLDLWVAVKRVDLAEALTQAKDWLGVLVQEPDHKPRREFKRPAAPRCQPLQGEAMRYLTETRCIPASVLERFRVVCDGLRIIFQFFLPDGELALAKARDAVDGAKPRPTAADCEPVLFGWQAMPKDARDVVICEGEIDALSWAVYGFNALSVPFGGGAGGKQNWIESEYDRLQRFEKIYLALDVDEVGHKGADEIASRLGFHRCYRVVTPHKDINESLQAKVPVDVIEQAVANAKPYRPEGLFRASDFREKVLELFWPQNDVEVGYRTPYGKLGKDLLFRPAEVTLWSGHTGSGKSQVLSHCCVDWLAQGSRICIASLEMTPERTLKRMSKQAGGIDRPTEDYLDAIMRFFDQGLYLYGKVGKSGIDNLLNVFDYARAKYGCDQFIVDSFMRLGVAQDDYNGQEAAMFKFVDWTIDRGVHLHLVAHARKAGKDRTSPDTADVKGAMEITANAFNVITIWRDKKHEEALKNAQTDVEKKDLAAKPGVILTVDKQRNGDFEGRVGLWFDQITYRYRSSRCQKRIYVPFDQRKEVLA